MVKRIISIIGKEINGLHEAAYLLGFFAVLSQILALFRDRILASTFGAGGNLDLYFGAFRIPDIIFATVASLVSASVLIPFIVKKVEEGDSRLKEFINSIWTFYCLVISLFSIIAFFASPFLLKHIFPIFYQNKEDFSILVSMTRILLFSPIFLGLSNLFSSFTQVYKRFLIYAISPVLYNIGIIFGIVFLYPIFGLKGLALGVVLGAFLHFFIQIVFVWLKGFGPSFVIPDFKDIKKIIFISLPRTITLSSSELSELFLISFASFLIAGSISVFNFSFNLQSVPYSIIGISYSLAAFPTLTNLFSKGHKNKNNYK
jgi:putative peptidoglycan lipid II flippase